MQPIELGEREESRVAAFLRLCSEKLAKIEGGVACFAGVQRWATTFVGFESRGALYEEEVEEVLAFFRQFKTQPNLWVPHTSMRCAESLLGQGWCFGDGEEVWYRTLKGDLPTTMMRVETTGDFDVLSGLYEMSIGEPADEATRRLMQSDAITNVVAFDGDTPVGCAMLHVFDSDRDDSSGGEAGVKRIGGLAGAVVHHEHQNRGVHKAMVAARLQLAKEADCAIATMAGPIEGVTTRNAERCGMQLGYVRHQLVMPDDIWSDT